MEKLSGKTALVTGSTDGVGRLVARKLGTPRWREPDSNFWSLASIPEPSPAPARVRGV
jgi:hypothetical protein